MAVNSDSIMKRNRGLKLDTNNNLKETTTPSMPGNKVGKSGDIPSFVPQTPVNAPNDENIKQKSVIQRKIARLPSPNLRPDSPHPLTLNARSNIPNLRPWSASSSISNKSQNLATPTKNNSAVRPKSANQEKKTPDKNIPLALTNIHKEPSGITRHKKKVSFAPDVVLHERESKPPRPSTAKRALAPFGDRKLGFFIPPASELIKCSSPIPNSTNVEAGNLSDREIQENDYVSFTYIWRTPNMESRKNDDKCIVRLKRIHNIMTDLTDSHSLYRYIPESIRTKFLQEEILPRYVMALDLVLTESLLGVATAIISTVHETVKFLHNVFYGDFFDKNHTPLELPSVMESGTDYVDKVAPIIFTLNRISGEHPRSDSSYMSKETACTKLLLELMALTVLPVNSVMFRCVLGIIPNTAENTIKYLSEVQDEAMMGWVNNSVMRREFMICMTKLGLADEFGAKAVLPALSLATIYAMSANNTSKKNATKEKPKHRSKTTTIGSPNSPSRPTSSQ